MANEWATTRPASISPCNTCFCETSRESNWCAYLALAAARPSARLFCERYRHHGQNLGICCLFAVFGSDQGNQCRRPNNSLAVSKRRCLITMGEETGSAPGHEVSEVLMDDVTTGAAADTSGPGEVEGGPGGGMSGPTSPLQSYTWKATSNSRLHPQNNTNKNHDLPIPTPT